ncbi:response regulator receiver domain protein [Leptospira fainei serovar Hurstbridge str. BUT 6]|uniref:Response regulator receiver domain protein n=1 Tax=Leptospira fainei serovar Hurstbridge str. BUT 6 TaxID=1193011 RepID=S3UYS1_9LEPT|nr:response regulator [Leptospira fainei]EPG75546.1 response regulator receiver domain protein [Leptospira fainei serovar Hurstbridge str. BUT 6]
MRKVAGLERILLIDDDEMANFIHQRAIKKLELDVQVDVAHDGVVALDILKSNRSPNLIFLDIRMPRMDGWEFLEEYRKLNSNEKERIIILMLTTSLNPDDQERSQKFEEISLYINKPLSPEKLETIIEQFFKNAV